MDQESNHDKCKTWSWTKVSHAIVHQYTYNMLEVYEEPTSINLLPNAIIWTAWLPWVLPTTNHPLPPSPHHCQPSQAFSSVTARTAGTSSGLPRPLKSPWWLLGRQVSHHAAWTSFFCSRTYAKVQEAAQSSCQWSSGTLYTGEAWGETVR